MEQSFKELYKESDLKIMQQAEDSLNPKLDRVDEIIAYAKHSGLKTIGIANCISFNKEADKLEAILMENGFMVEKINCKYGKIPASELKPEGKGILCNPVGQAQYLAEKKTELNIMMGLCVGHDMIFNMNSKAPVTPLIVKDRKLKHNPLQKFNE